jgi:hypothetical protein
MLHRKNSDSTLISSELLRILHNLPEFCIIFQNSAESSRILQNPSEFCWFLQNAAKFTRILKISREWCWFLQNSAESVRMMLILTGLCRIRQISIDFYRPLPIPTEPARILTEIWLNRRISRFTIGWCRILANSCRIQNLVLIRVELEPLWCNTFSFFLFSRSVLMFWELFSCS